MALPLLAAGCGGGEDAAAGDAVPVPRATVADALTAIRAEERCQALVTARFVADAYGSQAKCRRTTPKVYAHDVRVGRIRTAGDRASARVRLIGGATDGAAGGVRLRRAGDRWKLDGLAIDLERSVAAKAVGRELMNRRDLPGLNVRRGRECIVSMVAGTGDDDVHRLVNQLHAKPSRALPVIHRWLMVCVSIPGTGAGGLAWVRAKAIEEVAKEARSKGYGTAVVECVRRRLTNPNHLGDDDFADAYDTWNPYRRAARKKVARVIRPCVTRGRPAGAPAGTPH